MKTTFPLFNRRRSRRAMTLVELMTSLSLFVLSVTGLIAVNLFGLKQDELVSSQMGASDEARVSFNMLLDEIRSGKNIQIGYGSYANFVATTNALQQGDTIQIKPSTNFSCYIYYYFITNAPTNGGWLMRAFVTSTNNGASYTLAATNIMAKFLTNMVVTNVGGLNTNILTNAMLFSAVGYNGNTWGILTNDPTVYSTHNYMVNVLLQFYQYQYPLTKVGPNYLYSYYQIQLSAARRAE